MRPERRPVLLLAVLLGVGLSGCEQQSAADGTAAESTGEGITPMPSESTYAGGTAGRTEDPSTASTLGSGGTGSTTADSGGRTGVEGAGTEGEGTAGGTTTGQASGTQGGDQPSTEGRQFVATVAQSNLLQIQAGQLAAERASSEEVKSFANTMVRTYTRVNDSLKQLAQNEGVPLPTTLDERHQALLEKLGGLEGAEFDQAYSNEMVRAHRQAVQVFERAAKTAQDTRVQSFAQNHLPSFEEHLRMAQSLPGAPRG